MESDSEYLSPLKHPFRTQTPIWVMVGGVEVLYDGLSGSVKNMRYMKRNEVELYEVPYVNHNDLQMGNLVGWDTRLVTLPLPHMNSCKREANLTVR
jgi:hypothetical protein